MNLKLPYFNVYLLDKHKWVYQFSARSKSEAKLRASLKYYRQWTDDMFKLEKHEN